MRQFLTVAACASMLAACAPQDQKTDGFTIKGTLEGAETGAKLVLARVNAEGNDLVGIDTVSVDSTKAFAFQASLEMPEALYLKVDGQRGATKFLADKKSSMTATINLNDPRSNKFEGSVVQAGYDAAMDSLKSIEEQQKALGQEYQKAAAEKNKAEQERIIKAYEGLQKQGTEKVVAYVKANPKSAAVPFLLTDVIARRERDDLGLWKEVLGLMDTAYLEVPSVKRLRKDLDILEAVAIGQPAPDFSQNDAEGNSISLSSFKGKPVLIDFWASWCGPCRRANPEMVATYKKYKDKGFQMFGVSLDENKDKWLKAIEDDGLEWQHVSDLKGWGNAAAKQYGVKGIPHTVLIDAEGKIVAKNLHGEELQKKIEELL
ncbi:thiol:disulfide interchange protein [Fulvitalea axinellae]|uniref:Thiol:disulfide interchange protein n=1 Tax=Fulvitalea axinellae TaxID=1182444 RepID=A0AAU9DDF6_9BACT|nr:thiol:disulfide interchange protein [Fulvitalea axinellae]